MSNASCSYQVTYIPDGTTVAATLMCPSGDVEQVYQGSPSSPTVVVPNFEATGGAPVLAISVMESDASLTVADIVAMISDADVDYYINGERIHFNATTGISEASSAAGELNGYTGCFRKILSGTGSAGSNRYRADAPMGGLEIIKNLPPFTGGVNINVRVDVGLQINGTFRKFSGSTVIKQRQSVGDSSFAHIYCDNNDSFILNETTNTSVVAKVSCFKAGVPVTPSSYKWYIFTDGLWGKNSTATSRVPDATTAQFTIDRDMVSTFTDIMVECYDANGDLIATDLQTVHDASDELYIEPNPSPADGKFYQTGGPTQIVFTPKLLHSNGTPQTGVQYKFTVVDSAGVIQNMTAINGMIANTTLATSFTLPKAIIGMINEGPNIYIEAYC